MNQLFDFVYVISDIYIRKMKPYALKSVDLNQ